VIIVVVAAVLCAVAKGNPGAGIGKVEAFENEHKDGFARVECVKDYMLYYGDKYGNNADQYKLASVSNVSIVHYTVVVPKVDRKAMTPTVCFDFCRTVKGMNFFGLHNGRDCYCTPYHKAMASDSSDCDAPCDGDSSQMCGGKTKSEVYSMHKSSESSK